jgi:hypothetical protein
MHVDIRISRNTGDETGLEIVILYGDFEQTSNMPSSNFKAAGGLLPAGCSAKTCR